MTRREIIIRAYAGQLSWTAAADILGVSARHMRRIKKRYDEYGVDGLRDRRAGQSRRRRVSVKTIREVIRLKKEVYPDFSMKHFHEKVTEEHGLKLSYTLLRGILQDAGVVQKAPGRGKYRRRRERRPQVGMMLHMDASTHEWIAGLPKWDLNVVMDDADGRILFAQFVPEEGTHSTMAALDAVLKRFGRFAELYTDRGSHFCRTPQAGGEAVTDGHVSRACQVLGIKQILARSPAARGRSERAFGTLQGRLPQELRLAGITNYDEANVFLEQVFVPDFNERFTVEPAESASAFIPLAGIDLSLVLSEQYERTVHKDNTIRFENLRLQLSPSDTRAHFVRCKVTVHRLLERSLAVTHMGRVIGNFDAQGTPIKPIKPNRKRVAA